MSEAGRPEGSGLYSTEEEIVRLVEAFEACTLPQKQWTHQAHLTVGLWYVVHYPLEEATRRIRLGIQRYNESCGVRMTRDGGYHETRGAANGHAYGCFVALGACIVTEAGEPPTLCVRLPPGASDAMEPFQILD